MINKKEMLNIYSATSVDLTKPIERQPIAISFGRSNFNPNYHIPFGSYGDFSVLVGQSKSKKTFMKSAIVAGYSGGQAQQFFPDIKGHDNYKKLVLDFDTEQGVHHASMAFNRVVRMCGSSMQTYYKPFTLRELMPRERLEFIDWMIMDNETHRLSGNLGLVVIDGIADLMNNTNDLEESLMIANKLMKWSKLRNCHIITILHKNYGSDKPTGHIGSAVMKKAETVATIDADDETGNSIVGCAYSRNERFDPFEISVNADGIPYQIDNF